MPHGYILSDNVTEFKNQLYGCHTPTTWYRSWIFSTPYNPHSNGKLEIFNRSTSSPHLRSLCENDLDNWDQYLNQVLTSYCIGHHSWSQVKHPFSFIYGRDPKLTLHQLLEPMQCFLGDPDSGHLNLDLHHLKIRPQERPSHCNVKDRCMNALVVLWDHPGYPIWQSRRQICKPSRITSPSQWDLEVESSDIALSIYSAMNTDLPFEQIWPQEKPQFCNVSDCCA